MAYTIKKYGYDVSELNSDSDWQSIVTKNDFVILRASFTYRGSGTIATDSKFNTYYNYCKNKGTPVGVYHYSVATSTAKAEAEATYIYNLVKNLSVPYGIWFDVEDSNISGSIYNAVSNAFCNKIKSLGYAGIIGIYANASAWSNYLTAANNWYRWVADWGSNNGAVHLTSISNCYIQQYTSIAGPNKHLDANVLLGVNPSGGDDPTPSGGEKKTSSGGSSLTASQLDALALATIKGSYGNGATRVKKLGANYDKVQQRVNQLWKMSSDVIAGKYGNGSTRAKQLGSQYSIVQKVVNWRLGQ